MSRRGGFPSNRRGGGGGGFRDRGRGPPGGHGGGFRDRRPGGGGRGGGPRRDDRRRDDRRDGNDRRRDSFGGGPDRGMKRRRDDSPPRRRGGYDNKRPRRNDYPKGPRDGRDRRGSFDRRNSFDRRRSYDHQSPRRGSSSGSRNERDKMPPPKRVAPRGRLDRSGGSSGGMGGSGMGNDRLGGPNRFRREIRTSAVHKRLAEKHNIRRDRGREMINKRIRMAKLRSAINKRRTGNNKLSTGRLTTKKSTAIVEKKSRKASESTEKTTEDMWDDDTEKEIHEEEAAAKKAVEGLGDESTSVRKEPMTPKKERRNTETSTIGDDDTPKSQKSLLKRALINLTCVHCGSKCQTILEYKVHLDGRAHRAAMHRVALRQTAQLARMRQSQRNAQKEADESADKDAVSKYCQLCRLFYKQPKEEHQQSEDHRSIKKFLMPFCSVCKIGYKSPMAWETHRSSLHHLRQKAKLERCGDIPEGAEKPINIDNFTTVDEVGEIDGDIDEAEMLELLPPDEKEESEEEQITINVGSEHIKKVEVSYCELCVQYISHRGDQNLQLQRHCSSRSHMRNYIRYKDDKALKKEAEALHKKRKAEREKKDKEQKDKEEKEAKEAKENGETKVKEDETESIDGTEKESTDVNHEDEDSVANERFDKFKLTEKNGKLEDEDTLKNGDAESKEIVSEKTKVEEIKNEEAVEA